MGESLLNKINMLPTPISNGGTGSTTASEARTNLELYKVYSLYENSSGTTNTITLIDTYTNYPKIGVYSYYNGYTFVSGYQEFYTSLNTGCVCSFAYVNGTDDGMFIKAATLSFSGTSVTFYKNNYVLSKASGNTYGGGAVMGVTKIVGYKY